MYKGNATREVTPIVHIHPEMVFLTETLNRLMAAGVAELANNPKLATSVSKRYWSEQLIDPTTKLTYGFIIFSLRNEEITKRDYELDPDARVAPPELFTASLHIKQADNPYLANMSTAVSVRHEAARGKVATMDTVIPMFVNGMHPEALATIQDLIIKATPQLEAFNLTDKTIKMSYLITENEIKNI